MTYYKRCVLSMDLSQTYIYWDNISFPIGNIVSYKCCLYQRKTVGAAKFYIRISGNFVWFATVFLPQKIAND
jgi:hypothetical protein